MMRLATRVRAFTEVQFSKRSLERARQKLDLLWTEGATLRALIGGATVVASCRTGTVEFSCIVGRLRERYHLMPLHAYSVTG
jgi:hypothetical protein